MKKVVFYFILILISSVFLVQASWAAPPLIISGHPNYPPYMWKQNGKLVGVGVELAMILCKELDLVCEVQMIDSWKRVQELTRRGKIDLLVGAYSNDERHSYMDYTIAYMQDPTYVFIHKDRPFPFSKPEDLIGKHGITMYGESFGRELDQLINEKLRLTRAYSAESLYMNLHSQRVDYVLWGYYPWYFNVRTLGGETSWYTMYKPPIATEGMHITLSKKSSYRNLIPAMNQIIQRLQQDGTIDLWRERALESYLEIKR